MSSIVLSALHKTLGKIVGPKIWKMEVGRPFQSVKPNHPNYVITGTPLGEDKFSAIRQLYAIREKSPDKVLFIENDRKYTASEIYTNVRKLAKALKDECNVKKGDKVALMFMPEIEMVESYIAILALGAIPVPINFKNTGKTIAYMFQDSGAITLITGKDPRFHKGAEKLAKTGLVRNIISVNKTKNTGISRCFYDYQTLINSAGELSKDEVVLNPDKNATAIILYTSGTCGTPRGVEYTYEMIADNAERVSKQFPLTEKDVSAFHIPFYHLAGVGALNLCLAKEIVQVLSDIPIVREEETIKRTRDTIVKHNCTFMSGSPSTILSILENTREEYEKTGDEKYLLKDLRLVASGGSRTSLTAIDSVDRLNYIKKDGPKINFATLYGSTELGFVSSSLINGNVLDNIRTIGAPFDGTEMRIAENGELEVKPPVQIYGYLNRPELNKKLFTPDGFTKTGDEVTYGNAHDFIFLRRLKVDGKRDWLNIKGNKASPVPAQEEIEKMEGIGEVYVFGITKEDDTDVMCALIIPRNGILVREENIRAYLDKKEVPRSVSPSIYFIRDKIPDGADGCINGGSKVSDELLERYFKNDVYEILKQRVNKTAEKPLGK